MSLMKSLYIAPALFSLVLSTTISFAQAETPLPSTSTVAKTPPSYGDNPNIFEVIAHKTSDKVVNTAEKVGDATERGVAKIKPKVDQAWDNITAKHTVDVPIEQKSLSHSSNNETTPTAKPLPSRTPQPQLPVQAPVTNTTPDNKTPLNPNTTPGHQAEPTTPTTMPSQNQQQLKPTATTLPQTKLSPSTPTISL